MTSVYFSPIICFQFQQFFVHFSARVARSLKTISDYQNIMGVWHVVVKRQYCKGHYDNLSHFLDNLSVDASDPQMMLSQSIN